MANTTIEKTWAGLVRLVAAALVPLMVVPAAFGWGREGHMMINRLAAENLPADVPAFLRSPQAIDEIEYLGPEPDRWKSRAESELASTQSSDHYIDMEWANLVGPLPRKRYDFIRALAVAQAQYPKLDLKPESVGMQPWEVEEIYQRLKSAMRDYRALAAEHGDTHPVEEAIIFYAGWLGHYVGDGSQPLHVTIQFNGWTGENPHGYTESHQIHALFESRYVGANIKPSDVAPLVANAPAKVLGDEWVDYLAYLHHSSEDVEKLYQLEKTGAFNDKGTAEGKAFTEERLAAGAIELRDVIYSAWVHSADPVPAYRGRPAE
jgi:hypothetical protein